MIMVELPATVFRVQWLARCLSGIGQGLLKILGWRVIGEPPDIAKYVLIGAPHTSNWDFFLFMLVAFKTGLDAHWMGKDSLFPKPVRRFIMWLGGIPIDRSRNNNTVDQMVAHFSQAKQLVVVIPPEGTRSNVQRWKSGFYHIAHQAGVPIVQGFIDGRDKTIGFGPIFYPSGDYETDIQRIQQFYADKKGVRNTHP